MPSSSHSHTHTHSPSYRAHKRQQLIRNDLLNFTPQGRHSAHAFEGSPRRRHLHRYQTPHRSFDRNQYVLANFRHIVVRPPSQRTNTGYREYASALRDANVLVDWNLIELVEYDYVSSAHDELKCPICLDTPVAPKITKCGHVYCYTCILQYLDMGGDPLLKWSKCPMCSESIDCSSLRSTYIVQHEPLKVGQKLKFELMQRPRDCIMPYRKSRGVPPPQRDVFPLFGTADASLCRYNVTYDILPILQNEREQLEAALSVFEAEQEVTLAEKRYYLMAQQEITSRELEWAEWTEEHLSRGPPPAEDQQQQQNGNDVTHHNKQEKNGDVDSNCSPVSAVEEAFGTDSSDEADENKEEEKKVKERETIKRKGGSKSILRGVPKLSDVQKFSRYRATQTSKEQDPDYLFYYQLSTERHIFLHPINSKMLVSLHGSYRNMPLEITASAVEIEHVTMDETTRRKYSFLGQIPLYSDIYFVECDLREIVPRRITQQFQRELQHRKNQRRERARREQQEDKRIQMQEERERQERFDEMARREIEITEHSFPSIDESVISNEGADTEHTPTHQQQHRIPSSTPSSSTWGLQNVATSFGGSLDLGYMPSLDEAFGRQKQKAKGGKKSATTTTTLPSGEETNTSSEPNNEPFTEVAARNKQRNSNGEKKRQQGSRKGKVMGWAEFLTK